MGRMRPMGRWDVSYSHVSYRARNASRSDAGPSHPSRFDP
jgi:hypothetical protein